MTPTPEHTGPDDSVRVTAGGDPAGAGIPGARPPLDGGGSRFHHFFDDPRWALAVIRATVLEAAHPQVGAALLDNSTFTAHPWRRLRNTLVSLQRMFGADGQVRAREAARLNRLHQRISGADDRGRPYDALDPAVRAWVVATLFESTVTMCRLGGQPLEQHVMEELYDEFQGFLALLDPGNDSLPPTLDAFWPYYDRVVAHELENTEAMRIILFHLFDHLPAPPLLSGLPVLWAAGRAVGGPLVGAVTVASLPEPFRRRAGLPDVPGARTLMQGAYVTAGLARFLPEGWIRAECVTDLLYRTPGGASGPEGPSAPGSLIDRAAAFVRLVTPLGPDPAGVPGDAPRTADAFFREVLDQTGEGFLTWPDLAAMARELATRLDLDEPEETRLYDAFAAWWRELVGALDTDGDGRVSAEEYAARAPSLAGSALIRVAEVLFDVVDGDGDGSIDETEYRALFRTGFHRDVACDGGRYGRSAFVKDFLSFMTGHRRSTAFDPLLAQA
ncbi:oxygenase MpaB family protein [Streptomyces sp. NPDC060194]|uniref:oxygenase MpaB family protein n=1 Tax=Streptomyces sp. NPDC060194 TaxID=3347069 RepID=UPI0036620451